MSDSEPASAQPADSRSAAALPASPTASSDQHVDSDSARLAQPALPVGSDAPMDSPERVASSASPDDADVGADDAHERDRDAVATDDDDDDQRISSMPGQQAHELSREPGTDEIEQKQMAGTLEEHTVDEPEAVPNHSLDGPAPTSTAGSASELSLSEQEEVLTPIEDMLDVDLAGRPTSGKDEQALPVRPELAALKTELQKEQEDLVADTPIVKPVPAPPGREPDIEIGDGAPEVNDNGEGDLPEGLEPLPPSVAVQDPDESSSATVAAAGEADARPDGTRAEEEQQEEEEAENASLGADPASTPPPSAPETVSRSESAAASTTTTAASSGPTTGTTTAATSTRPETATATATTNRRESMASVTTVSAPGSAHLVSGILIVSSLESIAASKEAKKSKPLKDALDAALESLKSPHHGAAAGAEALVVDPHVVFLPLRLACETRSLPLMITALDCLGKLVSYDFFSEQHHDDSTLAASHHLARAGAEDDNESVAGGTAAANFDSLPLADQITSTVCDCFSPSPSSSSTSSSSSSSSASATTTQHDTLLLRLLSCLLGLILSSTLPVHQSALLKAVRTVYNVFLLGRPGTVQTVAQATLGQIVGGVFGRITFGDLGVGGEAAAAAAVSSLAVPPSPSPAAAAAAEAGKVSPSRSQSRTDLASVAEEKEDAPPSAVDHDEGGVEPVNSNGVAARDEEASVPDLQTATEPKLGGEDADTTTPRVSVTEDAPASDETAGDHTGERITSENLARLNGTPIPTTSAPVISENDLFIKDAFLVFRALCKLSMKPLGADSERDLKSPAMRSKLLSLHLVLTILHNHMRLFVDPHVTIVSSTSRERTPFLTAVKQYLCLALSRNAVSPVIQVFELSCEIFSRMLSGMRQRLKKEIEVLLNEIFFPILEMRTSTVRQKSLLLAAFARLAQDPQALVDIYLNYDCDRSSLDNIYERLLNIVSKLGTTHFQPTAPEGKAGQPILSALSISAAPVPLSATSLFDESRFSDPRFAGQPVETHIKRQSLECLVTILRSLVSWAGRSGPALPAQPVASGSTTSLNGGAGTPYRPSEDGQRDGTLSPGLDDRRPSFTAPGADRSNSGVNTPDVAAADDPSRFENAKLRKTTLLEGIKKFNFKPKRGVAFLIEHGFIRSSEPKDIARFLLHADGLDKAQIGEYLGEGDPANIAAMHAFVDFMDFTNTKFVDALRMFLQSFRLPGEAQKIDRYMLKFAERYTAGNPDTFANADTAYVLAFSVILLNTDAHNPQVKKPMSKAEFVKNNRGIDDGKDLDEQFLSDIYDEINANEIRMKDEVEAAGPQAPAPGLAGAIATVGRDLQREAYLWKSESMVTKTEALFRTLVRGQRRGGRATDEYYSASHAEHVRPMFEVAWMPILAGISGPLQDSDDMDLITLSLDGFKQAIKIVCLFDLELERNAFVTTLAKFTFLNNFGEMRPKNVEAIKTLLDIAMVDGNYLKGSWREVLTCVSQLERFQLIAQGVDSQAVPELGRQPSLGRRRSTVTSRRTNRPTDEVAHETRSQHITITADMIFSSTPQLSGAAIVDFTRALSEVSWEEIQASGLAEQPRVFCLQKLVEICYYNMNRIRLEWSQMWLILGEHFNQVTCHTNAKVSFLALDSLRQLAMRFLEKEELANFKFQKDFLKPFEYAMIHNPNPDARDMVLQCLHQMVQARAQNMRSGWRTMFGVFAAAAKVPTERVAAQAFDIVQRINREHFSQIVEFGSFADLTVCVTDFCKISKFQRISLQAIELLRALIPMMLNCPECPLSGANGAVPVEASATDDPMLRFWFPLLFGFYDVIMNGEDLEVRKRALDYLFETLKKHGQSFPPEFWDTVCKEVLFPIFAVLRSRSDVSRFSTHEDMSVWLSTTMIQALRNLVDLFTFYFDVLARMLDRLLDLLSECICQENDTLARIGTACLQQLVEDNVDKLSADRWERIVSTFVHLFKTTTAYQLFDPTLLHPQYDSGPGKSKVKSPASEYAPLAPAPSPATAPADGSPVPPPKPAQPVDRRRVFRQIIVKCVLQLLLIETTHELLQHDRVYKTIPPGELLRLMAALDESYRFARKFNADKDLRMALWKVGFMRDLPNLLRQESTSAATLVNVLLRMHNDVQPEAVQKRAEVIDVFVPLALDVLANYVSLNPETQARNITAWTPVCTEILQGFCSFEDEPFKAQLNKLYPLVTNTLVRDLDPALRECVRQVLIKVGRVALAIQDETTEPNGTTVPIPTAVPAAEDSSAGAAAAAASTRAKPSPSTKQP
ncbi:hypothetical protein JCM3774_005784 [Rhodotorula dairenensis]